MNRPVRGRRRPLPIAALLFTWALLTTVQLPASSRADVPPTVQFVVAPAPGETVHNPVSFSWQGDDVDGTVSLYRYVIDPPAFGVPYWSETSNTAQVFFFQSTILDLPIPASGPITFTQPHTLVLKAVDDQGLESDPLSRAFFVSTIAPEVQIVSPIPSGTGGVPIGTEVTISWQGTDSDGVFLNRPVKYFFRLLSPSSDVPSSVAWANPNAFRDASAPQFLGWDSTSGDTTSVHYTNLLPGQSYVFCVVGVDEVGAYSARFGRAINMVQMLAGVTPTNEMSWGRLKSVYR